jgi:hypothetical protein
MPEPANLHLWQNFYVIVGSAGGALVGVQFVVIALIANMRRRATAESISAFGTPTVVHFGGALMISAIMSAPWRSLLGPSIVLVVCGLCGLGYVGLAFGRARRQTVYAPVFEDWIWYVILPCSVYAALTLGALLLCTAPLFALFVIGGAALGLLLVGIHNAWDSVTHIVLGGQDGDVTKPD